MSGGAPRRPVVPQDDAAAGEQPGYTMPDGSKVETHVLSPSDPNLHQVLYLWTNHMRRNESIDDVTVFGFDVEWSMVQEGDHDEINPRVTLLKLGNSHGCLLSKLDFKSRSVHYSLRHFLLTKNITFVGINIKEGLIQLKCDYGIVIRNVVDLADRNDLLAFTRMSSPPHPACNLRCLVFRLLAPPGELKIYFNALNSLWVWVEDWGQDGLTEKQIEVSTIEVHLICRIAEKLLMQY